MTDASGESLWPGGRHQNIHMSRCMESLPLERIRTPEDPAKLAGGQTGSRSLNASATADVYRGSYQEVPDLHVNFIHTSQRYQSLL